MKNIDVNYDDKKNNEWNNNDSQDEDSKNCYYSGIITPISIISTISPETLSPIKGKTEKRFFPNFINANQSNKIDFNPTFVATSKTKNNLSDKMSLSSIIEPKITKPKKYTSGKKMMPRKVTDFTRVGYGSDCTIYDKKIAMKKMNDKTGNYIDDCINRRIERYGGNSREEGSEGDDSKKSFHENTSYSDYSALTSTSNIIDNGLNDNENNRGHGNEIDFKYDHKNFEILSSNCGNNNYDFKVNTDSEYNPNLSTDSIKTSISRPYVGYDDKIKREEKRKARYDRTCVNLAEMQRKVEESLLDKRLKELSNDKNRNEVNIRFDTNVFMNDIKSFKSQPVQVEYIISYVFANIIAFFSFLDINLCFFVCADEYKNKQRNLLSQVS